MKVKLLPRQSVYMWRLDGLMPHEAAVNTYLIIGNDTDNIRWLGNFKLGQVKNKQKEYTLHGQNVQQLFP